MSTWWSKWEKTSQIKRLPYLSCIIDNLPAMYSLKRLLSLRRYHFWTSDLFAFQLWKCYSVTCTVLKVYFPPNEISFSFHSYFLMRPPRCSPIISDSKFSTISQLDSFRRSAMSTSMATLQIQREPKKTNVRFLEDTGIAATLLKSFFFIRWFQNLHPHFNLLHRENLSFNLCVPKFHTAVSMDFKGWLPEQAKKTVWCTDREFALFSGK